VRALAELGRSERATKLLEMLSPIAHGRTPEEVDVYKVEPYVVAADVYGVAPHVGRGGWSWYTGSAGWMYRVALESLLGLTIVGGDHLELRPCVPESWPGYSVRMRLADKRTRYEIVLTRAAQGVGETQVHVDGADLSDAVVDGAAHIPLVRDGGVHLVEIALANDLTPRYAPASAAP
jgi:cyclic beta-1,2-glucan synthetase